MRYGQCQQCDAKIAWVQHNGTGRMARIDARASADGNIMVHDDGRKYQVLTGELLKSARDRAWPLYINHQGTCTSLKGGKLSFDEGEEVHEHAAN